MAATIDIDRMIEICFAAQFFVYGYMALFLYPYNDYDTPLVLHGTYWDAVGVVRLRCHRS